MKRLLYTHQPQVLALAIFVLWSIGRVVNPALRAAARSAEEYVPLFGWVMGTYVALHGVIFAYTLVLLWRLRGRRLQGATLWSLLLYIYVLLALLVSVYFIAYEFGVLSPWMVSALPYPFNLP